MSRRSRARSRSRSRSNLKPKEEAVATWQEDKTEEEIQPEGEPNPMDSVSQDEDADSVEGAVVFEPVFDQDSLVKEEVEEKLSPETELPVDSLEKNGETPGDAQETLVENVDKMVEVFPNQDSSRPTLDLIDFSGVGENGESRSFESVYANRNQGSCCCCCCNPSGQRVNLNIQPEASPKKLDGVSVVSFISGLASLFVPILGSLLAIFLGVFGLQRTRDSKKEGRGYAITGILLGATTAFLTLVLVVAIGVSYNQKQDAREADKGTASVAATQFSKDLVSKLSAGDSLPITKMDAGRLMVKSSTVPNGVSLTSWVKTPGQDRACFSIQTAGGATQSAVVTDEDLAMGRAASYELLSPGTKCPSKS